ncbi:MAG: hypothetical protein AAGG01_07800, partial [Planctomycetota bacterium]
MDQRAAGVSNEPVDPTVPAAPPKKGRSWLRRLGVVIFLGLVTALFLGPTLLGGWLRGEIERQATARVRGRVTVESVGLSLNGKATLREVVVEDEEGALVAQIPVVRVDVGMRSLLTGKKDVSAVIERPTLEVVRDEEGRWNLEDLVIPSEDPGDDADDDNEGSVPSIGIEGRLEVVDATVSVRSPDTMLQLKSIDAGVGLDGPSRGVTIAADASIFGGEGSVGDFALRAVVWPKAGPGVRLDEISVKGLDLGVVQETMLLVGSPLEAGSRLEGTAAFSGTGSLADLSPDASFQLDVEGELLNLLVDVRSGGLKAIAFDDRKASLELRAERDAVGVEPRATALLRGRDDRLRADVAWDGAASTGLTVQIVVDGLASSAGLEPLLARVHPVFASAQAIEGAAVDATVTSEVEVTYAAPLPLATLSQGWSELPKEPFSGTGSLSVDEGLVAASPFFQEVLEAFGQPANPAFQLKPLGFAVQAGRIAYTNPWTWTIQGTETRFAGSVGLDASLDLRWVVPVTGGLARQNRVFESIEGETFEVGLGGSLTSPTFNVAGALTSLAKRV